MQIQQRVRTESELLTVKAKLYIGSTVAAGLSLLAGCLLRQWQFPDAARFASYVLLAIVASTLKLRMPKTRGMISVNFLLILVGVAQLTLSETVTLGCISALVQSVCRTKTRPRLVQVLFNVSVVIISIMVAYSAAHALAGPGNLLALLASAACIYFLVDAGLVSLVLSLVEDKPFQAVWRQCYLWAFPYYLAGAGIASLISFSSRSVGWRPALLVLPVMYLIYWYYRLRQERSVEHK